MDQTLPDNIYRIRLIHTAVHHTQTNGKLERASRDDMKDFYRQYDEWHLEPLRRDLPDYVYYRNYVRVSIYVSNTYDGAQNCTLLPTRTILRLGRQRHLFCAQPV